jgi:aminopeptidase N
MDLYFGRCDGTAATVEDFIACFAEASGRDLSQFMLWYRQAGTPVLKISGDYDPQAHTFTVDLTQSTPPTPGQPTKQPVVLPVAIGLISRNGDELPLATPGPQEAGGASAQELGTGVFELASETRRIVFKNIGSKPVISALRGFSAPVRLDIASDEQDLLVQLAHDKDLFNRWQAAQTYATRLIVRSVQAIRAGEMPIEDEGFASAIAQLIQGYATDPAFTAQAVLLPGEADIAREIGSDVDPDAIHLARKALREFLGRKLGPLLAQTYDELSDTGAYSPDAASAGRRALRNALLDLYAAGDREAGSELANHQFRHSNNMTDEIAALSVLAHIPGDLREQALDIFYRTHASDALVIDKWFALQAMIPEAATLERVRTLMQHHAFSLANPNRLRSLIGSFSAGNLTQFHAPDGSGYDLLADIVTQMDARNPQVAARLLGAFRVWRTMEPGRRAKAEQALRRVAAIEGLSPDVRDIVDRSLA